MLCVGCGGVGSVVGSVLVGCTYSGRMCAMSLDFYVDGRSRYLYIVLGGYLCILGARSLQSCCPHRYLLPNVYLSVADIENPDLLACGCRTWIRLEITCFYEEQCHSSSGSASPAFPQKTLNRAPIAWGGNIDTICTPVCQTAV